MHGLTARRQIQTDQHIHLRSLLLEIGRSVATALFGVSFSDLRTYTWTKPFGSGYGSGNSLFCIGCGKVVGIRQFQISFARPVVRDARIDFRFQPR